MEDRMWNDRAEYLHGAFIHHPDSPVFVCHTNNSSKAVIITLTLICTPLCGAPGLGLDRFTKSRGFNFRLIDSNKLK